MPEMAIIYGVTQICILRNRKVMLSKKIKLKKRNSPLIILDEYVVRGIKMDIYRGRTKKRKIAVKRR